MSHKHAPKQANKIDSGTSRTSTPKSTTLPDGDSQQIQSFFPFATYTSIVGVHTTLLLFSSLFLPRRPLPILPEYTTTYAFNAADDPRLQTNRLTENPFRTAVWICIGTLILQIWWASWIRRWSLDTRDLSKAGKVYNAAVEVTEQKLQRQTWNSGKLAAFWTACLSTLVGSFGFAALAMLFGAPLYSHWPHTYALGLLVSLLTVFTPAYTLGAPSLNSDVVSYVTRLTWIRLFVELSPRSPVERAVVYPAVGAILGCWTGAIPAGLDWEEPWQASLYPHLHRWPLTTSYGAVGGFVVGSLMALGVSAVENLAHLGRLSQEDSSSLKGAHKSQGKMSKKPKPQ
ncbi:hypothetical protein EIP91_009792 [Steccherinum ochraceum]|uniref:Glycosylphosphatidylinositol (GPI) anchor assembly protein n=1 Tax=Steccherinum ochraceum TaxID=92696 RepID=A0A4R0RT94_9APHY|nr:hypothetical protein EIP91_009792 [Steccherinum ochraceum]